MSEPKISGGGFIIARKIIESEIMDKPPLYMKVWIYLLAKAQHKDYKGLKRGQLITSIPEIQEACSWKVGARREKPTKREIQVILDWMRRKSKSVSAVSRNHDEQSTNDTRNDAMIVTTKVTHGLLITICNYGFYQDFKNYERYDENYGDGYDEKPSNVTKTLQYKQECIKNDKNDDWLLIEKNDPTENAIQLIEKRFIQRRGRGTLLSARDIQSINDLLDEGIPLDIILDGIDQAFDNYQPKYKGDGIKTFAYCETVIRSLYERRKADAKREGNRPNAVHEGNSREDKPVTRGRVGWLHPRRREIRV